MEIDELDWQEGNPSQNNSTQKTYKNPQSQEKEDQEPEKTEQILEIDPEKELAFNQDEADNDWQLRQEYKHHMTKKFKVPLNNEIRRLTHRDLKNREVKSNKNPDRLYDYMKMKQMKTENNNRHSSEDSVDDNN